jgi:hypothetical protein
VSLRVRSLSQMLAALFFLFLQVLSDTWTPYGDRRKCLEALRDDPDIQVLQVKNRLHVSFDPSTTAGYRDVLVNGRFTHEEAVRYDIDYHVFEVQLILKAFAELKTEEGHHNYKLYRDIRAQ